jgi:hypothetical protein
MVLKSLLALFALVSLGCLGTQPAQRVADGTRIAVSLRLSTFSGEPLPFPASVRDAIAEELVARGFTPQFIELSRTSSISNIETSTPRDRMAQAVAASPEASWVLLVDGSARFFSQLTGRFRWDVTFEFALSRRDSSERLDTQGLSVPAFLQYEHEREPEAVEFVSRQLDTELEGLLDRAIVRTLPSR